MSENSNKIQKKSIFAEVMRRIAPNKTELIPEVPTVREDYEEVGLIGKVIECLRFSAASFEYRLNPNGWLRRLGLFLLRIGLIFGVPLVILFFLMDLAVLPVIGTIEIASVLLASFGENIFMTALYILGTLLVLGITIWIIKEALHYMKELANSNKD